MLALVGVSVHSLDSGREATPHRGTHTSLHTTHTLDYIARHTGVGALLSRSSSVPFPVVLFLLSPLLCCPSPCLGVHCGARLHTPCPTTAHIQSLLHPPSLCVCCFLCCTMFEWFPFSWRFMLLLVCVLWVFSTFVHLAFEWGREKVEREEKMRREVQRMQDRMTGKKEACSGVPSLHREQTHSCQHSRRGRTSPQR